MKKIITLCLVVLSFSIYAQEKNLINALGLPNGSFMYYTPPSYTPTNLMAGKIAPYTPEALFDLSPKVWCSKGSAFPHVFVMELTEVYLIEKLVFDNRCEANYKGIASKEVKVEFSNVSGNNGFVDAGSFSLTENQLNTFAVEPKEARWIKISILSNYGNAQYTELAEVEAYGVPKYPEIKTIDINGKWESNWGSVTFEQKGSSVTGNYVYNSGVIPYGGIERNKITYRWIEKKIKQEGWVTLFMNSDGTRLTGVWCYGSNWKDYGFWIFWRNSGKPIEPVIYNANETVPEPVMEEPPVEVNKAVVEEMKKELKKEGKLILYGINFKVNSSEILTSSHNVLNEVGELLKADEKLKIRIEGHTDNVGADEYNMKLSASRAEAVKNYLMEKHSIAVDRLETVGKGESKPVADNSTESGKAANRRVEIHQR